jgi:hypothetical protein
MRHQDCGSRSSWRGEEEAMAGDEERAAGKHYVIHDVGPGAKVVQGDHNSLALGTRNDVGGSTAAFRAARAISRTSSDGPPTRVGAHASVTPRIRSGDRPMRTASPSLSGVLSSRRPLM